MRPEQKRSRPTATKGGPDATSTLTLTREDFRLQEAVDLLRRELDAEVVEQWVLDEAKAIADSKLHKRALLETLGLSRRSR